MKSAINKPDKTLSQADKRISRTKPPFTRDPLQIAPSMLAASTASMRKWRKILNALNSAIFHLIILPTERCNLQCQYCYEDRKLPLMSGDVVARLKKFICRRSVDLKQLHIEWFGGEPLLALDTICEISSFIKSLSTKNTPFTVSARMTTNGYVLDVRMAERLLGFGVTAYQITLDGPQECHDAVRQTRKGEGSFTRIWNNLLSLRDTSLPISILLRIHLSRDNASSLEQFVMKVATEFSHDKRFSLLFKPIADLGGASAHFKGILPIDISDQLRDNLCKIAKGRIRVLRNRNNICYAAKANSFVIRPDGSIGKCTVALNNHLNTVGELDDSGYVYFSQDKLRWWCRGLCSMVEDEMECPYYANNVRQYEI